jgi:hypothetical protein
MTDQRWLRDALEASIPDTPPTDRLGAVRERRRRTGRRRNVSAVVAAALVVLVVAAAGIALGGRSDPADRSAGREPRDLRYDGPACPAPVAATGSSPGLSRIPDHPVSVRLCRTPGVSVDPPRDSLVTGANKVAAVIDDLAPLPAYPACPLDVGPGYLLLFAYSDGRTARASGQLGGCRQVTVGSTAHQGADTALDTFVALLRRQRATGTPRPVTTVLRCEDESAPFPQDRSVVADPTEMLHAVFCLRDGSGRDVTVDAADLATILADRPRRAPHRDAYGCTVAAGWRIIGTTPWGDRTGISGDCDYIGFGSRSRAIGSDVQHILTRLRQESATR